MSPGGTAVKAYHINSFPSDEDGGYIADLALCSAFGDTPEEAPHGLQIAKVAWLEAARAVGKAVPSPRYRPAISQSDS